MNTTNAEQLYQSSPPQSEMPWLRLSTLATGQQRLAYLEKALQINPYNKQTLRLIERLDPERAEELAPSLPRGPNVDCCA